MKMASTNPTLALTRAATVVCLALAIVLVVVALSEWLGAGADEAPRAGDDHVVGSRPPEPRSVQQLVDQSDVVLVGQVEDFTGLYMEQPNTDRQPPVEGVDRSVTHSTYRVQVMEYLVGEGSETVTLLQIGDATGKRPAYAGLPQPPEGERVILFLQDVSDRAGIEQAYVSTLGSWGQLVERDGQLVYGDGATVNFSDEANLDSIIDQVRAP